MFIHLIPLEELKRHSVTYWRPGRDHRTSGHTWIMLTELESGYETAVVDLPANAADVEDVLALVLRDKRQSARRLGSNL